MAYGTQEDIGGVKGKERTCANDVPMKRLVGLEVNTDRVRGSRARGNG